MSNPNADDVGIADYPLPDAELWPIAVCMIPFGVFGRWHTFALAKTVSDGRKLLGQYREAFGMGTWSLRDRQTGHLVAER